MNAASLKRLAKRFVSPRRDKPGRGKDRYAPGIFLLVVLIAVGTYFIPRGMSFQYSEYKVGMIAREEIIAPERFNIYKTDEEIERERREAREKVLDRFIRDRDTEHRAETNINTFFDQYADYPGLLERYDLAFTQSRTEESRTDSALMRRVADLRSQIDELKNRFRQQNNIDIDRPNWEFFKAMDKMSREEFRSDCTRILNDILAVGVVNVNKNQDNFKNIDITLIEGESETIRSINDFYDNDSVQEKILSSLQSLYTSQSDTINVGYELINNFIIENIKYDYEETEQRRSQAAANVPIVRGVVLKNQRIVDRHELITEEIYRKIESFRRYLSENRLLQSRFSHVIMYLGQAGLLTIIFLFFVVYLTQFRTRLTRDVRRLTMLFLIFFSQIFFIYIVTQQFRLSEYLIPTTIGSMLLAILFDGGIGFYGTIVLSFLAGAFVSNEFTVSLYALAGGTAAILSVRRIRTRSHFFKSTLYIFIAYALVLYSIGIMRMQPFSGITWNILKFSLPNAVFSPLITLGFLAFFEGVFGVATDMTLLELSDLNRPLLRELALRAPGTYHHSIVLGTLSERAAEAIGANSLLARVGCYYHDIGKMVKPEYFIENQPDAKERHESLAPTMSSLIISSHVRDGIEMAHRNKLPKGIIDFIEQHHGTSNISFFYEKAVEKSGSKYINESDFRYPGPKPQTKETGIVMLADGVEAATRALKDPSPARIRERVRSLVENKFREEQLDECELTLQDLHKITESFIQILTGIFHFRLEYPGKQKGGSLVKGANIVERPD